jgi:hypothetical protein
MVTFLPSRVHFETEYSLNTHSARHVSRFGVKIWTDGKVERAMSLQEVDEYNLYCLLISQRNFSYLLLSNNENKKCKSEEIRDYQLFDL